MTTSFTVAYVLDRALWERANDREENFWFAYVTEILDQLGLRGRAVEPSELGDADVWAHAACLIVGPMRDPALLAEHEAALRKWTEAGGVLIGFACRGLDALFGVEERLHIAQPIDPFTQNGFFALRPTGVGADAHSRLHPAQRLLVFSPVRLVAPVRAEPVASYDYANGRPSHHPAITQRALGAGWAFYFAFDPAQTLWALHQGRPVDRDYDGDGYLRTGDARIIGANEEEVRYADEILFVLQNMIARRPHPFVCACPPADGRPAHALLFWGGDDEARQGVHLPAAEFMASRGLPYHINVMPRDGRFAITRAEADLLSEKGCEIAVHYDHTGSPDWSFTEDDVKRQAEAFFAAFGRRSQCSVNHCATWVGWAEPARWMAACGGTADNSRMHSASPPLNPVNRIGFSFGSSLPYFFYDDWRAGNARLDFIEEPIAAYEVGYYGDEFDPDMVHRAIDLAAEHRTPFNMFYHPCYIADRPACRAAIDEALAYIRRRGLRVVHMGADAVAQWWRRRSRVEIENFRLSEGRARFLARTDAPEGIAVKLPLGRGAARCRCNGKDAAFENAFEYGQTWTYVVLPAGETEAEIELGDAPA